jgi:hypothetical protein
LFVVCCLLFVDDVCCCTSCLINSHIFIGIVLVIKARDDGGKYERIN